MCGTAFGLTLSPEQSVAITTLGMALAGSTAVFTPDKLGK